MFFRRLAEDYLQPKEFNFNNENKVWANKIINRYPRGKQRSSIIPLLMRIQEQEGWISKAAIEYIADFLSMKYIQVLEIVTFYNQFHLRPVGKKAHIQVCGTVPCMLLGSEELENVCRKKIHPHPFEVNISGSLSWESVECLGACINAPVVMIFKDTYENLTPEILEEIIVNFESEKDYNAPPGNQKNMLLSINKKLPIP